jgi:hypothetical protein
MSARWLALCGLAAAAVCAPAQADDSITLGSVPRAPAVLALEYPPPAPVFRGFFCRLDLDENEIADGVFLDTDDSVKYCRYGESNALRIECDAPFPGYSGEAVYLDDVPCDINATPCDIPGLTGTVRADSSTLKIEPAYGEGDAHARLVCEVFLDSEG